MDVTRKIFVQLPLLFVVLLLLASLGSCLQCYKCYDATRHCYTGNTNKMTTLNCSSAKEICAVFQYEVDDSVRSPYVVTIRGCQPIVEGGICKQLMNTVSSRNVVQKGIRCETCETDLCNSTARRKSFFSILSIAVFSVILKVII